ncbi:MAG: S9 family peptidase [Actinobacteria bacterium]|nr:MAG: S9 family peptidase [Actinomycetota bacterium]
MPDRQFDVDFFLTIPRVTNLVLAPDGTRLVATVAIVAPDAKSFTSSLWELDPAGERPPQRLTRSAKGESSAAFMPEGSLLFTSERADPEEEPHPDGEEVTALWLLPARGGEARRVAAAPGGIESVAVAATTGTVAWAAPSFPGTVGNDDDAARAKARTDAGVTAQLFESYPIRFWDHYLGPREARLLAASPPPAVGEHGMTDIRDLTPAPGRALDQASFDISPDGTTVVTGWRRVDDLCRPCTDVAVIDTASGERRVIVAADAHHTAVRCSPAGGWAVCVREVNGDPHRAVDTTLWLVDLHGAEHRDLTPGLDLWPQAPAWAADGSAVWFVADQDGRTPVFRVDIDSGTVTRITDGGSFSDLCPSPDGRRLYALMSTPSSPPQAVVLDVGAPGDNGFCRPSLLPTPGLPLAVPGRVEHVTAEAGDGIAVRSWLVLPEGASPEQPAPLAVFIHGGPLGSWSGWHWRWNPHLLAARGYAVLLPDPALSTGYGQSFIERGWGHWGGPPYTDLMAAVDAALARGDIDETRTAALGGSFGGYMANWVAGHTDRFRAIVTHASLWALDQFHATTDLGVWWEHQFGDPYHDATRYRENSPHHHVGAIRTPMLVIHGELDHRVPVGESLRLWTDLKRHGVDARFLYFPDEHHWVQKPQNVRLWYRTVLAFLDHHVLGKEWAAPELL